MRQIFLALKMALQNFLIAKMRMFLTILGIVIGVASVIIVLSVGTSAQNLILDQIRSIGSNLVGVLPGNSNEDGPPASAFGVVITTLKNSDLEAMEDKNNIPHIEFISGYVSGNKVVKYRDYSSSDNFQGVSADMNSVENITIKDGRFFDESENNQGARVAVLGYSVAKDIFGGENPLGKKIKIDNLVFRVIGTLGERGSSVASNPDDTIYIPLKTAQDQLLGIDYLNFIRMRVDKEENLSQTVSDVEKLLKDRHDIAENEEGDFSVRNLATALDILTNVTSVMKFFLTAVAGISLVVGGIGVMNIMFITLHRRIREIGLRMSFGARKSDIISQFLVESMTISLIGGTLGILLGTVVIFVVEKVAVSYGLNWGVVIEWQVFLLAWGISLLIGVIFGLYPALKASRVSPMEALRHE